MDADKTLFHSGYLLDLNFHPGSKFIILVYLVLFYIHHSSSSPIFYASNMHAVCMHLLSVIAFCQTGNINTN